MIFGAQRSGTTLISRTFDSFKFSRVFGEFSELSNECPLGLRLKSVASIKKIFSKVHAPLIVMKPLVESQNAKYILDEFPNATGLWIYRNYKDVAESALKQFPSTKGVGNLLPILNNEQDNWRNDSLPEDLRAIVSDVYEENFSNYECACLFWYVRNYLFFSQGLDKHERVQVWEYESLLADPKYFFSALGEKIEIKLDENRLFEDYSDSSVNKQSNLEIRSDLKQLCEHMLDKLKNESGKI